MSELDKYFEKARNVEPIYEEEDTRKFLAGKLSDGGIATNLYNKIKVYPMLTALITSVATIATIAILSITSSDTVTEKANMRGYTSTIPSALQAGSVNVKSDDNLPEVKETKTYSVVANNDIESKESNENKVNIEKEKVPITDDNTIDIKTVNSLKLTKDELAKLGIELDQKSFKVNAFDKYTYTIFQSNEKTRDYYKKDEDQDTYPTPAMITTSTGFKTLTLFKKGNVEAIVDRVKNKNNDGEIKDLNVNKEEFDLQKQFANAPKFNMNNQSFADYKKSLSGNKDSAAIVKQMESFEAFEVVVNGKKTTINIADILNNADSTDREMLKQILKKSFVADNDSNGKALDLAVNVKMKDEDEVTELLKLNVDIDNKGKFDTNRIVLDSVQMAKVYAFDSQLKDYIANSKDSNINHKKLPDDLALVLDSVLKNSSKEVNPDILKRLLDNPYMRDLLQRDSDNLNVDMWNSNDSVQEGTVIWVDELKQDDLIVKPFTRDLLQRESDSLNLISINSEANRKEIKVITEKYEIQDDKKVYDNIENDSTAQKKIYEIKIDGRVFSIPYDEIIRDGKLDQNKYKEFMLFISKQIGKDINVDSQLSGTSSNKIEKVQLNIKTELEENVYIVPMGKLIIEDGETEHKFELKPGQTIWADENQDGVNKSFKSNMSFDFINYNINELIPIEVSFDGVKTDFIVWYEASEDFLTKLPHGMLEKINPELAAISEQEQHCNNAPIKKDDAVMDVWSGCSGAIKEMKVFPNPANNVSKVEFELEDNRQVSIAVYDLSGKLIKKIKNSDSYSKGRITEALNLNGVNPGLYYVVVKSDIGEQALQRIIIE